ncbi:MAG TPA: hypothetical protein VGD65_00385 [Chryseosolibacter sp.]
MFCWHNKLQELFTYLLIFTVLIAVVSGCSTESETSKLYDVDSLLNTQVKILANGRSRLQKQALLGDETDMLTYIPDSAAWNRELDVFRQLEAMNKPVHRTKYLVDDNLFDPGSNLTVKAFTALESLPVRSVRVFYDKTIRAPRKIEAVYDEENALYKSSKKLLLEFQQINNKNVLTSYSIEGGQKMILSDSVTFSVTGRIQF